MQKHWDVMRTDNAGDQWKEVSGNLPTDFGFVIDVHEQGLSKRLPQKDCYVNVLGDAMSVDRLDKCGMYFGTTGGQVYASADAGNTWKALVHDLPSVLSVEVQTLK